MSEERLSPKTRGTMRMASYLLPDPGGEVVRECLDALAEKDEEIKRLEETKKFALNQIMRLMKQVYHTEPEDPDGWGGEGGVTWKAKADCYRKALEEIAGDEVPSRFHPTRNTDWRKWVAQETLRKETKQL